MYAGKDQENGAAAAAAEPSTAVGQKREAPSYGTKEPPAKRPVSPRNHEVTILLPIDAVGLVIGKGGQTLKRLTEESGGAQIRVQEYMDIAKGSKQRGVIISGPFDATERIEREIIDLLRYRRQKQEDLRAQHAGGEEGATDETPARKTLRWMIPAEMSGLLIGKRGIGREAIQQESGAYIKLAHEQELPPGSNEKLVYIEGTDEAIEKARELIEAKVGGRPMDKTEDDFIYVNIRAIGFLLGKGGSELKKMCEESGARIQVAPASELETGSVEIKVRLNGEEEQVSKAKALLVAKMEKWNADHPPKDHSADPDGRESSIKVAVPAAAVSPLIGKGGAGVKEMNAKSGASVKFLSDEISHDSGIDCRAILLTGNLRNIFKAQRILLERLASLPASQRAPKRPTLLQPPAPVVSRPGVGILDAMTHPSSSISLLQPSFQSGGGTRGIYSKQQQQQAAAGLLGDYRTS